MYNTCRANKVLHCMQCCYFYWIAPELNRDLNHLEIFFSNQDSDFMIHQILQIRFNVFKFISRFEKPNLSLKCLYLYWITLSARRAVFPRGPVRATPRGSSVTRGGNRSTLRKPAMLGFTQETQAIKNVWPARLQITLQKTPWLF